MVNLRQERKCKVKLKNCQHWVVRDCINDVTETVSSIQGWKQTPNSCNVCSTRLIVRRPAVELAACTICSSSYDLKYTRSWTFYRLKRPLKLSDYKVIKQGKLGMGKQSYEYHLNTEDYISRKAYCFEDLKAAQDQAKLITEKIIIFSRPKLFHI